MTSPASQTPEARFLYAQTPDGKTHKRKTARTYTHAVAFNRDGVFHIAHWCGSLALAQKQLTPTRVIVEVSEFDIVQLKANFKAAVEATEPQPAPVAVEPEPPKDGKAIKIAKHSGSYTLFIYHYGRLTRHGFYEKSLLARAAVLRFIRAGYTLFSDEAGIVSPLSTYRG